MTIFEPEHSYTVKQAALMLGTSRVTLHKLIRRKLVDTTKIGDRQFIHISEIDRLLQYAIINHTCRNCYYYTNNNLCECREPKDMVYLNCPGWKHKYGD